MILKLDSHGKKVGELQRDLNALDAALRQSTGKGFLPDGDPLVIDRDFGKKTAAAVEAFQHYAEEHDIPLVADGKLGPLTKAALRHLLRHSPAIAAQVSEPVTIAQLPLPDKTPPADVLKQAQKAATGNPAAPLPPAPDQVVGTLAKPPQPPSSAVDFRAALLQQARHMLNVAAAATDEAGQDDLRRAFSAGTPNPEWFANHPNKDRVAGEKGELKCVSTISTLIGLAVGQRCGASIDFADLMDRNGVEREHASLRRYTAMLLPGEFPVGVKDITNRASEMSAVHSTATKLPQPGDILIPPYTSHVVIIKSAQRLDNGDLKVQFIDDTLATRMGHHEFGLTDDASDTVTLSRDHPGKFIDTNALYAHAVAHGRLPAVVASNERKSAATRA